MTEAGTDSRNPPLLPANAGGIWLKRIATAARARRRLVCFGHAGSTHADFAGWAADLGPRTDVVAVCLPGRRERIDEAPRCTIDPMANEIANAICAAPPMPTTLFGHSFGGILAYEVAQRMQRRDPGQLKSLVISACTCSPATALDGVDETDQAAVLQAFERRGYLSPEHLANKKLIELVLPYLLADVLCKKRWQSDTWPPLGVPIHTFAWAQDPLVSPAAVRSWRAYASQPAACEHLIFPGAHLEYLTRPPALFGALDRILAHGPSGHADAASRTGT
ncbi:MAG: alpha/beta fold hydrolase [Pseudomonadota bacterium]